MIEQIGMIMQKAEENNVLNANDYMENGIIVCGVCNTAKQVKINFLGEEKIVYCMCKCGEKQYEKLREEINNAKKEEIRCEYRLQGGLSSYRFDKDDGHNPEKTKICKKYCFNFEKMLSDNIGLMLYGSSGTGKTFLSCCIANELIDNGFPVKVTNFSKIINDLSDFKINSNDYIYDICNRYDLLVIDDYGAERNTSTALQYVEDIINARYEAKKPLIITTNKNISEIQNNKNQDTTIGRINSRITGMTVPICVDGSDMRKAEHYNKMVTAKKILIDEVT